MIPDISFCTPSNDILNNFTLEYKNKKTRREFINYSYSFPKYILFTIFELILSVLLVIGSANYYKAKSNTITIAFLVLSCVATIFSLVCLIVICVLSRKKEHRNVLYYFLISAHTFILGLIFYSTRLLISSIDSGPMTKDKLFVGLFAGYIILILFHATVIESCFLASIISAFALFLIFFIFEIAIKDFAHTIFIYPFLFVIRLFLYTIERKEKLFFHYFKKFNLIYDIYKKSSNDYSIASFSSDNHCFINPNYINVLSVLTQSKAIKELKDYEYYPIDFKIKTNSSPDEESFVSFMKVKCFFNIKNLNEILPEELRVLILNIKDDDISTIDIALNYIRSHSYLFPKITHIGEKTSLYCKGVLYNISLFYDEKYDSIVFFSSEKHTNEQEFKMEGDYQLQKFSLFASKITHDIKNPLQAIIKLIQNINTYILNKECQNTVMENLNLIMNYSEYMLIITKDFECFAKRLMNPNIEKLFEIELQKVNIRKTIQFCSDLIMQIQNKMAIYVTIEIGDDVDQYIYTDDIRLKQILINLLSNSIKFTKIGSIKIKCSNIDSEFVLLSVSDTGFGMRKEELDKLNNDHIFYKSTINNAYGSGLGISIVKTLIKLLGKDLKIESQYNKGTTVSFLINKNNKLMPTINSLPYKTNQQTLMSESTMKFICEENNQEEESMNKITRRVEYDLIKPNYPLSIMTKLVKSSTANSNPNQKVKDPPFLDFQRSQTNYRSSLYFERLTATKQDFEVIRACSIQRNNNNNDEMETTSQNPIVDESNVIRILLVEDVNDIRNSQMNLIKSYCKKRNIKVSIEECCDGFECLYKIYQGFSLNQKYACIITDDSMKFLSGTFTSYILKTLMQDKTIYPIKIYLTSANTFPRHLFEGIQLFDGIYNKPLDKNHIETVFNAGFY